MGQKLMATSCGIAVVLASALALLAAVSRPTRIGDSRTDDRRGVGSSILEPIRDNTLYSEGDDLSNGAGQYLFAGRTNAATLRRAVLAFDIAGSVPAGSAITSVTLTLNLSRSFSSRGSPVSLHRLLADWGEGASNAPGEEGIGAQAEPDDATWIHRFFDTTAWAATGGDFEALNSAALTVSGNGPYTWSSDAMIADVQRWLDDPASNFGWIVVGEEGSDGTAKRFDSRDHATDTRRPMLIVHYGAGTTIVVNTTVDGNDAVPGDGVCEAAPGNAVCSLRAAIEETNALPGLDTIQLPAGNHALDLIGSGEDAARSGDLDVTDLLNLVGDGARRTIIDGGAAMDRVFHIVGNPTVQISGVTVTGGNEDLGGGVWNLGTLTVRDSTIRDNRADLGSALCNDGGTVAVLGCTIEGNTTAAGRAAVENLAAGGMTLSNSTIGGNTGNGLVNADGARMDLNNVTVAGNSESGIHAASTTAIVELSNTLIAESPMGNCSGEIASIVSLGFTLDDDDTCGLSATGDLVLADALLGALQDNGGGTDTYSLSPGSPAIDAGNPGSENDRPCEVTDQRGTPRLQGAACDIGAFEADAVVNQPPVADAGADSSSECSSAEGGIVRLDGSGSTDPDGDDIVLIEWFLDFTGDDSRLLGIGERLDVVLPLGSHVVTCRVTDSFGETDTDDVLKTVEDTEPPTISVQVHPRFLWPPNDRMVRIETEVSAADACGMPAVRLESISSNEGDGDDVAAAEMGQADHEFMLRAKRKGSGNGRVYTIVYTATDQAEQSSPGTAHVVVPHDMGRRGGRKSNRE